MRYTLELEDIGSMDQKFFMGTRAWVAKVSLSGRKIERSFVKPLVDYADANSKFSRGVYKYYFLDNGDYEISSPQSWKCTDRYFLRVKDGKAWGIDKDQICRKNI